MSEAEPTDAPAARRPILPPHVVMTDFLPPDVAAALYAYALANESRFEPSSVGYGEGLRIDPACRLSVVLRDLGPFKQQLRDRLAPLAPALSAQLKTSQFEITRIELELAAHGDGAFFERHLDTHRGAATAKMYRILSGVYYFHAQPKAFGGGALRLHELLPASSERRFLDIEPAHNTLVAFPSWMPHEVLPVSCSSQRFADSRFAINCWFYRAR